MMRLVAVAGDYKVVNSALDNLLIRGSEIFIDFSIRRCQKVAAKLLFGRGRPAKQPKRRLCRSL